MMRYGFLVAKLLLGIVPFALRRARIRGYISAMLRPLQTVNDQLAAFVASTRYYISFSGQVMYIERRLNDQFDPVNRAIYIDDPGVSGIQVPIIFNKLEAQPDAIVYNKSEGVDPLYIYNIEDYATDVDFVIYVPVGMLTPGVETLMRGVVDVYRQAGRTYSIIEI